MICKTKIRVNLAASVLLWVVFILRADGHEQECLFIQFDKSFYVSGETIWFKVYLLNDESRAKSRVLHVDLVNPKNESIVQQKLLINNRTSFGNITLPVDCNEGFYQFRAYTHYNLNFKSPFVYETSLPIYQPEEQGLLSSDDINPGRPQPSDASEVSITTDKEFYKPRDSLTVSLQIQGSSDTIKAGAIINQ